MLLWGSQEMMWAKLLAPCLAYNYHLINASICYSFHKYLGGLILKPPAILNLEHWKCWHRSLVSSHFTCLVKLHEHPVPFSYHKLMVISISSETFSSTTWPFFAKKQNFHHVVSSTKLRGWCSPAMRSSSPPRFQMHTIQIHASFKWCMTVDHGPLGHSQILELQR